MEAAGSAGGRHSETALVVFTSLVPLAFGMALLGLVSGNAKGVSPVALVAATIGMSGSITHLARPFRAPSSLRNWRSSWLSREIVAVSVFWFWLALWFAAEYFLHDEGVAFILDVISCICGAVLLFVISTAYRVDTRPAWNGPEGIMELVGVGLGTGAPIVALLSGSKWVTLLAGLAIAIGMACDVCAHRRRCERLETEEGPGVAKTRANYQRLWGKVQWLWALDACAIITAALALLASGVMVLAMWAIVSVLEIVAHVLARQIFYDLPVQERYIAWLR